MEKRFYVGQPYRGVCLNCGQLKQVVPVQFPTDLVGTIHSTRLCEACSAAFTLQLLAAWSVFHPVDHRS
jgi:hypothetical protein